MSFPLVANDNIKTTVTNALSEGRLPHAIIIEGDIGTGKHTLAKYLAKSQVCSAALLPCESCNNCHLADIGNHPDITIISPEDNKKNISVSQIRSLKAEAYIKPHMSKKRVFIIDFAHTMNEQSQNALLKVLEEPPESVSFILIAESKAALLETVISRCVVLSLSVPEISVALEYLKINTDYLDEDILSALKENRNNIGKTLWSLSGKKASLTDAAAEDFIQFLLRNDSFGMLSVCSPFEKNRIEADNFFKSLKLKTFEHLRKNLKTQNGKILSKFYSVISELELSLNSNINLSLLFSVLVSRTEKF